MESNGGALRAELDHHSQEIHRLRERSHLHGNKLTEHETDLEGVGRTLQRLDASIANLDAKMEQRFVSQDDHINKRFDKLSAQGWRIAAFVVSVMVLAAAVVSLIVQ